MRGILESIQRQGEQFAQARFFRLLEGPPAPTDVAVIARNLAFFVFGFQDILRLNVARIVDPELRAMSDVHRKEDAGHELWFLRDASKLGADLEVAWVLGRPGRNTRDCTLELIAEVFQPHVDPVRVLIPIVIDVTGEAFFSRAFKFFRKAGKSDLEYFSESHWEVERSHELFEDEDLERLRNVQLTPELREEAQALVNRMFAVMHRLVEHFHARLIEARGNTR
jgi:hypothetical protein